jgi:hypothetical protein
VYNLNCFFVYVIFLKYENNIRKKSTKKAKNTNPFIPTKKPGITKVQRLNIRKERKAKEKSLTLS